MNNNQGEMLNAVNQGLNNMNIPPTNQLAGQVLNMIQPYIANEMNKAAQSNQVAVNALGMVQQLMLQNQSQIMQIAKLKQELSEMPRLFTVDSVTGCGYCLNNGREKKIGIIKIQSVYNCPIEKNGIRRNFKYVCYSDSDGEYHNILIPPEKFAGKNLISLFHGFMYVCRSKELANDYLANCVNNFPKKEEILFPEYPGFMFFTENGVEKADFKCNDGMLDMELLRECSVHFMKKVIPKGVPSPNELKKIIKKYLNTNEKCFLFQCSICGLLSSFLREIHNPMEQILAISASNPMAVRQANCYMQIFNRGSKPISFDSSKSDMTKAIINAKDETVIINDCNIIDDDGRRNEMLRHILTVNDSNDCQPHNLAIFSDNAQYLLPAEKKICLTLPDDFAVPMTKAEEAEMCSALNAVVNSMIYRICSNYTVFKNTMLESIDEYERIYNGRSCNETKNSLAVLLALNFYFYDLINDEISPENVNCIGMIFFITRTLKQSERFAITSPEAIAEQFIEAMNQAIRSNELNIIIHSKNMNYIENSRQFIVKDDLLVMEEDTINKVILPRMRITRSICRILKSLESCGYLHATKKNRYPLTVYSDGRSLRPALIAIYYKGILDLDVERLIQENEYSEWFMPKSDDVSLLPVVSNSIGQVAYQKFDLEKAINMHFFAIGQSGSGKTHCLTERMCSLQKFHHPIIIFDTSDSFSESEILEKLSSCGDEIAEKKVRKYIKKRITFHKIEEQGLPVDILKQNLSANTEAKIREVQSIIESHNSKTGVKQKAAIYKAIRQP
ncbi:MAG: hypothetical protein NC548_36450 [Lachnospiraceae bacterium]|nr:hypothetical protein [Lachnospiraceae bacterium]MCM1230383.1 hypothetical protein [Ruminococcus flavefaciens]